MNFPFYQENLLHDDVFQGDESSADIELKDLGGGVTMLHHEDHEGHFEDMKLGSSSSASRSPSYQSANTSINSRDIEIPRSKLSISSPPRIFKFYFGFQKWMGGIQLSQYSFVGLEVSRCRCVYDVKGQYIIGHSKVE